MYNFNSSPTVSDCIFSQNITTLGNGGAVYNRQSNPIVTNCMFTGNTATDGGGMYNFNSSPTVSNCIFSNNHVIGGFNDFGGAIDNTNGSAPYAINCLFTGNSSDDWGGAIANVASSTATILNCTFAGNSADDTGGGLHIESDSTATIENCIFWGNSDAGGTDESAQIHGGAPAVTYSCIQGCTAFCSDPEDHNIGDDPLFASRPPPNEDEQWYLSQTASGQGVDSPCVDSGAGPVSAFYVMGTTRTDQVDDTGIVDLGYHYNATLAGPAIPTVSEWGMVLMSLLVLTAGTLVYGRRAPACP